MKKFLIVIFAIVLFVIAKIFGTVKPEWSTQPHSQYQATIPADH